MSQLLTQADLMDWLDIKQGAALERELDRRGVHYWKLRGRVVTTQAWVDDSKSEDRDRVVGVA